MKSIYTSIVLVAAAAMTFVSCTKEIENPVEDNTVKMKTIKVRTAIDTKTTLDSDHANLVWAEGDAISLFNNADETNTELTYAAGGDIEVEVPDETTEIYAHYPYYSGNEAGPGSVSVYISNKQTQTNPGELNGRYYPMVAKGTVSEDNKALISFYPVASALALNIYNTNLSGTETVKSVKVTPSASNTKFTGSQVTDITVDKVTYTEAASSDPITVTLTNGLALSNSAPADKQKFEGQIYVCLAKQSYSSVTFEITTDKGTYSITSSSSVAFDCENNDFIPVNINLAKAESDFATTFTVGSEIASVFPSVKNGIKFEYAQGESTNAPAYYSPFRWYKSSQVTISAGDTPLKGVTFTFSGGDNYVGKEIAISSGTYTLDGTTGIWTPEGEETAVTFTSANQARFSSITVNTEAEGTETVVTSTPALTVDENIEIPAEGTKQITVTTDFSNGEITYSSSDESVATVSSTGTVTGIAPGKATITTTITGVTSDFFVIESVTASTEVTVTAAEEYEDVTATDWNYVFTSNPWGATSGDTDLTSGETTISWKLSAAYASYTSGYLALNTASNKNAATISTNNAITNVGSVVVYAKTNSGKKVTLTVKVGDATIGEQTISNTNLAPYTFASSSAQSGKITIDFTDPDGGYQIKQIRINPVTYNIVCESVENGTISASSATAFSGDAITLTATPDDGYELDSWFVKDAEDNEVSVSDNTFTMPSSNVTVSAVFKEKEEAGGDTHYYVKVTSSDNLTSGDYLIVYGDGNVAFNGELTTLDAVSNTISVTISDNKIVSTSATDAAIFTYDATTKTLKSASGYYIGQTSDANGLKSDEGTALTNTISFDNDGNANIVSSGGAYLRYNATSGQTRFRYYKSSSYTSQKAIQLYKLDN